jgi:ribosomal RNA assembly protein
MEIVRIPAERVSTIIGKEGKTKEEIEKKARVKLDVSREGEVTITGDMTDVFFAKDIVKAIGRGFDPKDALKLLKEGYCFYLIDLKNELDTENAIKRIKGRIIGEDGKVKSEIEDATDSYISVFGNTVGIISKADGVEYAKEAIFKIIDGAPHTTVFNYLAKIRKQMMTDRLRGATSK